MNVYLKFFLSFFLFLTFINISFSENFNVCNVNFNEPWFEIKDNSSNSLLLVDNDGDVFRMANNPIALAFGDDIIVKNTVGTTVANLNLDGSISQNGVFVTENSQASCNVDGNYCLNSNTLENRNYYCDLTGNRAGSCQYLVSSSTTCSDNNYLYCNGLNRYEMQYSCSGSSCSSSPTFLQSCSTPSTSYGSWSCSDSDTRVRTNTYYSASCSPESCGYSSSSVSQYQNCGSGQVCSSGSCVNPPENGVCGSSLNSCSSGIYQDRSDWDYTYVWNCLGINGGSDDLWCNGVDDLEPDYFRNGNWRNECSSRGSYICYNDAGVEVQDWVCHGRPNSKSKPSCSSSSSSSSSGSGGGSSSSSSSCSWSDGQYSGGYGGWACDQPGDSGTLYTGSCSCGDQRLYRPPTGVYQPACGGDVFKRMRQYCE